MPLQRQIQQTGFRFGVQEGTDPHAVPFGTLTRAENVRWAKAGAISKRFGTSTLSQSVQGGGAISAAARLFARGSELNLIDGTDLYAYSSAQSKWKNIDRVPDVGLTWSTLLDTTLGVQCVDHALSSGGYLVTAWTTGDPQTATAQGYCYVQVTDRATGAVLMPASRVQAFAFASSCRVLISGTNAFILTRAGASTYASSIDLTTMTLNTAAVLRNDGNTTYLSWDAMLIGSSIVIAYVGPGPSIKLYAYSYTAPTTYTQTATGGVTGEAATQYGPIAIDGQASERIWVVYGTLAPSIKVRFAAVSDSTLAQTIAPTDIETASGFNTFGNTTVKRLDSGSALAGWTSAAGLSVQQRASSAIITTAPAVTTTSLRGTWSATFLSRIFAMGSKYYAFLSDDATAGVAIPGTNSALVEIETSTKGSLTTYVPHRYAGRVDLLIAGAYSKAPIACLPGPITASSTEVLCGLPFQSAASVTSTNWRCGIRLVSLTTGASLPTDQWRTVTYGPEAYVSGPVLSACDGRLCFDYGGSRAPAFLLATPSAGGSMAAGNYLYACVAEFRSSAGILHRSATVTYPTTVTSGAAGKVTLDIMGLALQSKQDVANGALAVNTGPTLLALYRTAVGGSSYYRLTAEPRFNIATNDPMASLVSPVDNRSDSAIDGVSQLLTTQPLLYTMGGILDDYQPPAFTTMVQHRSRLWGVDGGGRTVWFSKAFSDDPSIAPGFHPNLRLSFDSPVTALASMDDKLVAFGADWISYFLGDGPSPAGTNSDLSNEITIQTDVGCTNPRSVVSMPDGVMFQSDRGIYLLTRALELVWIGRPIMDTLASYPTITSATLVAKRNEIRFTANNAGASASRTLVWNYVEKQWSVSRYAGDAAIADACMWSGAWTFVTTGGLVYQETESTYLDAGTYVPMVLETAWISAAGPLAYHSVRTMQLEGVSASNHDLTIECAFDGETSYVQSKTFAAGTPVTTIGPLEQAEITIGTRRKCQHIRFRLSDATPSGGFAVGTGQGPALDTMGIEVGVKQGFAVNPATKKG